MKNQKASEVFRDCPALPSQNKIELKKGDLLKDSRDGSIWEYVEGYQGNSDDPIQIYRSETGYAVGQFFEFEII